jgi:hypothetical protein
MCVEGNKKQLNNKKLVTLSVDVLKWSISVMNVFDAETLL